MLTLQIVLRKKFWVYKTEKNGTLYFTQQKALTLWEYKRSNFKFNVQIYKAKWLSQSRGVGKKAQVYWKIENLPVALVLWEITVLLSS